LVARRSGRRRGELYRRAGVVTAKEAGIACHTAIVAQQLLALGQASRQFVFQQLTLPGDTYPGHNRSDDCSDEVQGVPVVPWWNVHLDGGVGQKVHWAPFALEVDIEFGLKLVQLLPFFLSVRLVQLVRQSVRSVVLVWRWCTKTSVRMH